MNDYTFESTVKGATYKGKTESHTFYMTVNNRIKIPLVTSSPFEIFVRINDKDLFEMITLVTRLTSMLLQSGTDPLTMAKELQDVYSPTTRHMIPKTNIMCPSIIARIGVILENHIKEFDNATRNIVST